MISNMFEKGGALCLSFFCVITTVVAQERARIDLGVAHQRVSYAETSATSFQLNKESGLLPVMFAKAQVQVEDAFFYTEASYAQAEIDYRGYTQSFQPLQTQTDTTRSQLDFGLGYQLNYWSSISAGVSQHYWDREIQGTRNSLPLDEYYEWKVALVGLNIRLFKRYLDRLDFSATYGRYFDESLEVDLSRLGYGKPNIPLKGSRYEAYQLSYAYSLTSQADLIFDLSYTRLEFDQSKTVTASNGFTSINISEPASRTGLAQLGVGISYKF